MPTENRSSNTEMVSVLQREDRYIVIKRSDLERISAQHRFEFSKASRVVHERMFAAGAPARRFLVIESDWPEYEPTWAAIERRVNGSPAPQPHPEPIAWMVDTAEVERLRSMFDQTDADLRSVTAERDTLRTEADRLRQEVASIDKKLRGNVSDPDPLKPIMPGALSITTTYGLVAGIVRERDQLKNALERKPS